MKHAIVSSHHNLLLKLFFLVRLARKKVFCLVDRDRRSPIQNSVTGVYLSIAAFIFMVLSYRFLSSNAFWDFFSAILILCLLTISGAWIEAQEASTNEKKEREGSCVSIQGINRKNK